jgi:large subunit ribosomal protein L18
MNTFKTFTKRIQETRIRRDQRVTTKVRGTATQPRVSLFRSHKHIAAQIINDLTGQTLAAASSQDKELRGQLKHGGNVKAATLVAQKLAERAKAKNISLVVFDKGWYKYHGRVKAFADALRKGGLKF